MANANVFSEAIVALVKTVESNRKVSFNTGNTAATDTVETTSDVVELSEASKYVLTFGT
jgi:hypothetical protein